MSRTPIVKLIPTPIVPLIIAIPTLNPIAFKLDVKGDENSDIVKYFFTPLQYTEDIDVLIFKTTNTKLHVVDTRFQDWKLEMKYENVDIIVKLYCDDYIHGIYKIKIPITRLISPSVELTVIDIPTLNPISFRLDLYSELDGLIKYVLTPLEEQDDYEVLTFKTRRSYSNVVNSSSDDLDWKIEMETVNGNVFIKLYHNDSIYGIYTICED